MIVRKAVVLMKKSNLTRTGRTPLTSCARGFGLVASILCIAFTQRLNAQSPCPAVETFATGLLGPCKIIQTPPGNFLVAEGGIELPNNGRVSIVDQQGQRRTLLEGLPSAQPYTGAFNG